MNNVFCSLGSSSMGRRVRGERGVSLAWQRNRSTWENATWRDEVGLVVKQFALRG